MVKRNTFIQWCLLIIPIPAKNVNYEADKCLKAFAPLQGFRIVLVLKFYLDIEIMRRSSIPQRGKIILQRKYCNGSYSTFIKY